MGYWMSEKITIHGDNLAIKARNKEINIKVHQDLHRKSFQIGGKKS